MKKLISILVAVALCIGLLPMSVMADGGPDGPTEFTVGKIKVVIGNADKGDVWYRLTNSGDWTHPTGNVVTSAGTVYFKAAPKSNCTWDDFMDAGLSHNTIKIGDNAENITDDQFAALRSESGLDISNAENTDLCLSFMDDGSGGDNGGNNGGDNGGDNGGGQGEQGNPQSTNWDALKSEIKNYTFAYGPAGGSSLDSGAEQEMLKAGIAAELYDRKMGNGPGSSDTTLGMALSNDEEAIAGMIHFTDSGTATDADVANLRYYTFNLVVPGNQETTEITEGFTIEKLRVYVLDSDKEFLLKTTKNDVEKYEVVTYVGTKPKPNENEELDRFVNASFDVNDSMEPAIEAYGNGIFLNNAISEDGSVFGFHAACEHCGSIGNINCRLIVSSAENSIQISSTDDAAAWNFINVGVYAAEGTKEEPVNATIFFGSETISFSKATGNKEVTNVEPVDLPSGAVYFDPGTKVLTFKTNYDEVLVEMTYNDGSVGYMMLNRVGLNIDSIQIDKKADVTAENNNRFSPTDKDQCTADTFNVWHGSDQSVRYVSSADKVIVGSFYYDCNYYVEHDNQDKWHVYDGNVFVADSIVTGNSTGFNFKQDAVDALRATIGSVQLLVTITDNNNNVTRKLVSDPLSGAKAVNNGGFNADVHNAVGYAGQGSNHVYDDFLLWSGSEAEYANIKSVSAIVYNAGNANTFGGVKVGSGTGVQWTNSAE